VPKIDPESRKSLQLSFISSNLIETYNSGFRGSLPMKLHAPWLSSAFVILAVILSSAARPALADSYTIYNLGDDNSHGIYGIDSMGDVVIWGGSGCGPSSPQCYVTYTDGVATSDVGAPPTLAYDDGSSCSSTPAGFNVAKSVCNNGWIGFGAYYYPDGGADGVYTGSGSNVDFLHSGSADQVFLNSAGDFAWVDGLDDEMFVAIRNAPPPFETNNLSFDQNFAPADPAPEPGSLLFVGTGLLLFGAAIRRKMNRPRPSFFD
jgi:hypothetical protein